MCIESLYCARLLTVALCEPPLGISGLKLDQYANILKLHFLTENILEYLYTRTAMSFKFLMCFLFLANYVRNENNFKNF